MRGRGLHQVGQMLICHSIDRLVFIDPHPFDGFAAGHLPDHHVTLSNVGLTDLVGVFDADGELCTMWIEVCPVCGLDCPSG